MLSHDKIVRFFFFQFFIFLNKYSISSISKDILSQFDLKVSNEFNLKFLKYDVIFLQAMKVGREGGVANVHGRNSLGEAHDMSTVVSLYS